MFAFRIDRDHLSEKGITHADYDRKGNIYGEVQALIEYDPVKLKLYDDDGELYYTVSYYGDDTEEIFAPQDWAGYDAGVTTTKIKEGNKWVIL
jgi:hypothetical protein